MLSERQRADLRAKLDAARVDPQVVQFKTRRLGVQAFCPVCLDAGMFRSTKAAASRAQALELLGEHLMERHRMRFAVAKIAGVDAADYVTAAMFA